MLTKKNWKKGMKPNTSHYERPLFGDNGTLSAIEFVGSFLQKKKGTAKYMGAVVPPDQWLKIQETIWKAMEEDETRLLNSKEVRPSIQHIVKNDFEKTLPHKLELLREWADEHCMAIAPNHVISQAMKAESPKKALAEVTKKKTAEETKQEKKKKIEEEAFEDMLGAELASLQSAQENIAGALGMGDNLSSFGVGGALEVKNSLKAAKNILAAALPNGSEKNTIDGGSEKTTTDADVNMEDANVSAGNGNKRDRAGNPISCGNQEAENNSTRAGKLLPSPNQKPTKKRKSFLDDIDDMIGEGGTLMDSLDEMIEENKDNDFDDYARKLNRAEIEEIAALVHCGGVTHLQFKSLCNIVHIGIALCFWSLLLSFCFWVYINSALKSSCLLK